MRGRQEAGVPGMGWVLLARARVMGLQQGGEAISAGEWLGSEGPMARVCEQGRAGQPRLAGEQSPGRASLPLLTCMSACT